MFKNANYHGTLPMKMLIICGQFTLPPEVGT